MLKISLKNYVFLRQNTHSLGYLSKILYHRVSQIFPINVSVKPKCASQSIALQLMSSKGLIHDQDHAIMPLGLRAIGKLIKLLDTQMRKIKGQKLSLSTLTSASLWEKSGRLEHCGKEVMQFYDRKKHQFILSPTHEEPITDIVGQARLSYRNLPLRLYQISSKFRDEARPKHGLMRGKEFLMKDMYTFDLTQNDAENTFKEICTVYSETLQILKVPFIEAEASVGLMGGIMSHEFHIPLSLGDDFLKTCSNCNYTFNCELDSPKSDSKCPKCEGSMSTVKGLEVGHAFLLGTKYSSPLNAKYKAKNDENIPLQMGCYGIGVTRLFAAALETLSSPTSLVWPLPIVPYKVCIISPQERSEKDYSTWCNHLELTINKMSGYEDEVIVDDRIGLSIGKRLYEAKSFGYPVIIVIGKSSNAMVPHFEVFLNETDTKLELTQLDLLQCLEKLEYAAIQ